MIATIINSIIIVKMGNFNIKTNKKDIKTSTGFFFQLIIL